LEFFFGESENLSKASREELCSIYWGSFWSCGIYVLGWEIFQIFFQNSLVLCPDDVFKNGSKFPHHGFVVGRGMIMSKEGDINGYFLSCWLLRVIKILYC
jgi:hypothetical protein